MYYFVNLVNGELSINSYRNADCEVTTLEDLKEAYDNERRENLVASVDDDFELNAYFN